MFVAIAVTISSAYALLHLWQGDVLRAMFIGGSTLLVLFTLVLVRRPQGFVPATHFLLTVMLGMIVGSPTRTENEPKIFLGAIVLPLVAVAWSPSPWAEFGRVGSGPES